MSNQSGKIASNGMEIIDQEIDGMSRKMKEYIDPKKR
jgi:hypothetical protein